jgi:hypothetical protein
VLVQPADCCTFFMHHQLSLPQSPSSKRRGRFALEA